MKKILFCLTVSVILCCACDDEDPYEISNKNIDVIEINDTIVNNINNL